MASNRERSAGQAAIRMARIISRGMPEEFLVAGEPVRIGSAPDNAIVLDDDAVAAHHLSIEFRYRCWMLRIESGCARVYVNARPVRELALLRLGDSISVGAQKLCLLPLADSTHQDSDTPSGDELESSDAAAGLRCVAGPLSGRILGVRPELLLDANVLPDVSGCLRLQATGSWLRFHLVGDAGAQPCRNGLSLLKGELVNGDQLSWGRHRFVVEATTAIHTDREAEPSVPAVPSAPNSEPAQAQSEGHELAWLLGVAAVLAAVIALLLLLRP